MPEKSVFPRWNSGRWQWPPLELQKALCGSQGASTSGMGKAVPSELESIHPYCIIHVLQQVCSIPPSSNVHLPRSQGHSLVRLIRVPCTEAEGSRELGRSPCSSLVAFKRCFREKHNTQGLFMVRTWRSLLNLQSESRNGVIWEAMLFVPGLSLAVRNDEGGERRNYRWKWKNS